MLPAQQRFHANDATRGKRDDGLVMDPELVLSDSAMQIGFKLQRAYDSAARCRFKDCDTSLATSFGFRQGDVRIAHQFFGMFVAGRA